MFDNAVATFYIDKKEDMKELIDTEMMMNEDLKRQSFSGVQQAADATKIFSKHEAFIDAYLESVDWDSRRGVVKFHLFYDTYQNDSGKVLPKSSGFFEKSVIMPYAGGYIDNPWYSDEAADYLEGQWLKEAAIWSRAVPNLLKTSLKKHVSDNDQHMKGVFKNQKQQPDRKRDCGEPALYFHAGWKEFKESSRTFVADLENTDAIVSRRKDNAALAKLSYSAEMTKDAKENEMFLKENAIWDTGATGLKAETKLMNKLEEIFVEPGGKMNFHKWHIIMKRKIEEDGVGGLKGMAYQFFWHG